MPRNITTNKGFQKVIVEESEEDDLTGEFPDIKRAKPSPAVFDGKSLSTKSILSQLVEFVGKSCANWARPYVLRPITLW